MSERALFDRLRSFRDFAEMPDEAGTELARRARVLPVNAQEMLATQGSPCTVFPLVLAGRARIFVMDDEGREITLYRLSPGDGCVLAAACSVSDMPLPGFSICEVTGEGLFIPSATLRSWIDRHSFWREYVFSLVAKQLGQVVAVTNDLAFRRLDTRIASFLLQGAERSGGVVRATHQEVALEVGSRREVVSRILKGFEQDGLLTLERGAIRVEDRRGLAARAGHGLPQGPAMASLLGDPTFGD